MTVSPTITAASHMTGGDGGHSVAVDRHLIDVQVGDRKLSMRSAFLVGDLVGWRRCGIADAGSTAATVGAGESV